MIELDNGYVIAQTSSINWVLRQRYTGLRNGVETECFRTISHHNSIENAVLAFLSLFPNVSDASRTETFEEYLKRFKSETERAVEAVNNSMMQRFYTYVPKGNGNAQKDLPIIELLPIGRDNAIPRKTLINRCIASGLISPDVKESTADRKMRDLLTNAKQEGYTILNLSDGNGYYRLTSGYKASLEEIQDLQRYIRQEENRGKVIFKNISMTKALYEDLKHGRF